MPSPSGLMEVPGLGGAGECNRSGGPRPPSGIQIRPEPGCLERSRVTTELQRRQGTARRHHLARRSIPAAIARGRASRSSAMPNDIERDELGCSRCSLGARLRSAVALANKMARTISEFCFFQPKVRAAWVAIRAVFRQRGSRLRRRNRLSPWRRTHYRP